MSEKTFISAESLLADSYRLAAQVIQSDFRPNFIVGVWRGGTPVGIAVQELFDYYGLHCDHIAIRTSSYYGIDQTDKTVRVHGLDYIIKNVNSEDGLLIVDDVFDSGRSIMAIIETLERKARKNTPADIRVATAYYKPDRNSSPREPDYYVHETADWLVFPHEMSGLTRAEVRSCRPWIADILAPVDAHLRGRGEAVPE
ncbi:MAG: phosphoribosyltransferase family protein [Pseudomonadota bacterium]